MAHIHKSMYTTNPYMVVGEGQFCTSSMHNYRRSFFGRSRTDGYYGIAIRASPNTFSEDGLGHGAARITVKTEGYNIDIFNSAVMRILDRLDIGSSEMRQQLDSFHHPVIKNA